MTLRPHAGIFVQANTRGAVWRLGAQSRGTGAQSAALDVVVRRWLKKAGLIAFVDVSMERLGSLRLGTKQERRARITIHQRWG